MLTHKLHFFWRDFCMDCLSHSSFFATIAFEDLTAPKVRPNCFECTTAIVWGTTFFFDLPPTLVSISRLFVYAFLCFSYTVPQSVLSKSYCHSISYWSPVSHLKFLLDSFHNTVTIFYMNVSLLLYPPSHIFHSPWPLMSNPRGALISVVKK